MKRLLWIGDAVASTGFARCTHRTLDVLKDSWNVAVLGLNYMGDPHRYPYPIFPCAPGGDAFGLGRTASIVQALKPELIVVQNDPWNVPEYLKRIPEDVKVVAVMPVDGKNCRIYPEMNRLAHAIFWTEFGLEEARKGGLTVPASVIPLGVDTKMYAPIPKEEARLYLPESVRDAYIVGNVNRNQPRKRLDLTVRYFAKWAQEYDARDAYLYLHVAPTGDQGYDLIQLMAYYGFVGENKRLILAEPEIGYGIAESNMSSVYSMFDVQISTTQGEGWGLTTLEGMACGVPQIVPKWSALGEWAKPAVRVTCSTTCVTPNFINVIGGVPDEEEFVQNLEALHANPERRRKMGEAGIALAHLPQYSWENIGKQFVKVLGEV